MLPRKLSSRSSACIRSYNDNIEAGEDHKYYDANLDPPQDILYLDPSLRENAMRNAHKRKQSHSKTFPQLIARLINTKRKQSILTKHNTITRRESQKHRIHGKERRSEQPGPLVRELEVDFIGSRPG